jgi:hypothetical protein
MDELAMYAVLVNVMTLNLRKSQHIFKSVFDITYHSNETTTVAIRIALAGLKGNKSPTGLAVATGRRETSSVRFPLQ